MQEHELSSILGVDPTNPRPNNLGVFGKIIDNKVADMVVLLDTDGDGKVHRSTLTAPGHPSCPPPLIQCP